jgi:hypothetical protein
MEPEEERQRAANMLNLRRIADELERLRHYLESATDDEEEGEEPEGPSEGGTDD